MKSAQTRQASVPSAGPYLLSLVKDGPPIPCRFVIKREAPAKRPDERLWAVTLDGTEMPDVFSGEQIRQFQADNLVEGSLWSNDFQPREALLHMRLMMFGKAITQEQYDRLLWKREWWRQTQPNHPALDPTKPIKISRVRGLGRMVRPFDEAPERFVGIGDNSRGFDIDPELEAVDETKLAAETTQIAAVLEYKYSELLAFTEEDLDDIAAFSAMGITDLDDCARAKDLVDHVTSFVTKDVQRAHDVVKAPVLAAGKLIDSFFYSRMRDPLLAAVKPLNFARTAVMRADMEAKRKALDEDRVRAKEEAERLLAEAKVADADSDAAFQRAMDAETAAQQAAEAAGVSTLDLTRGRTDLDRPYSLRETWAWKIQENEDGVPVGFRELVIAVANNEVDISVLAPVKSAIDGMVANGTRHLPGVHIYQEFKAR